MQVLITRTAQKQLRKIPIHVVRKLEGWVDLVESHGLEAARRIPGYRDEALKGVRAGQRSIRLNQAYRAIYEECLFIDNETGESNKSEVIHFVSIEEVNKHDY